MLNNFSFDAVGNETGNAGYRPGNIGNATKTPSSDVTSWLSIGRSRAAPGCRDGAKKPVNIEVEGGARPESNGPTSCGEPLCDSGFSTSSRRINLKNGTTSGGLWCALSGCRTTNPGLGTRYRIDAEIGSQAPGNLETVTSAVTVIGSVALPKAGQVFHSFSSRGRMATDLAYGLRGGAQ